MILCRTDELVECFAPDDDRAVVANIDADRHLDDEAVERLHVAHAERFALDLEKGFTEPASDAGAGVHLKNLYNDYVYFWRWALWRLFEQQNCGGVVTFITASSFIAGPGFVGVREVMRRTFDEIWIVDLGGDSFGTRKTPNIFNILTPVAITVGVRASKPSPEKAAKVHYVKVSGATRESKLNQLEVVSEFGGLAWSDCPDEWHKPFLPAGNGDFFAWPQLIDLFPWRQTGSQFQRTWPIAETKSVIETRWNSLVSESDPVRREKLFKRSRDRSIRYRPERGAGKPSLGQLGPSELIPSAEQYSFRSFDRHWAILDERVGDYLRPALLGAQSERQVFFLTLVTEALGHGPAIYGSAFIPDLNCFHGRHGMAMPLYRDAAGTEPNVTAGLLDVLGKEYGTTPSPEDLAAYVYALLGGQSYTRRFWNELETPGPRVPMTKDGATFAEAAKLGRKLIWLHTYAERFRGEGRDDEVPQGKASTIKGVSSDPKHYPEEYAYDPAKREIAVGDGRFGPVAPEVWDFEVSGLEVVKSWLGYRMKKRAGKKSSPLDDIRPERWTARMSDEFLELLWVLESTLAMEPELEKVLDNIVAGPCFAAADLPAPTPEQRKAPGKATASDDQPDLFGGDDEDGGDD